MVPPKKGRGEGRGESVVGLMGFLWCGLGIILEELGMGTVNCKGKTAKRGELGCRINMEKHVKKKNKNKKKADQLVDS